MPARPAPVGPRGPSSRRPWPPLQAWRPRRSGRRARRAVDRRRRVLLLEDRADPAVQPDAPGPAERRVERLANQRVGEGVAARSTGLLLDDPALRGLLERVEQALAGQLGKGVEHLDRERPADRGGHRHDAARGRRQSGKAPLDRLPHAVRDAELGERGQTPPFGPLDRVRVDEVAQDLLDEERVALGFAVKRVREMRRRRAPEPAGDHRRDVAPVQAPQPQPLDGSLAVQVREHRDQRLAQLGLAIGADDQHALGLDRAHDVRQEQCGRLVRPVQVLEHQHDRPRSRRVREQRAGGLEQAEPLVLRSRRGPARPGPGVCGRARERAARARRRAGRPGRAAPRATPRRRTDRTPRRTADRRSAPPRDSGREAPPRPPGEWRGRAQSRAASCRCPARRRSPRAGPTHPEHPTTGPEASRGSPRGRRTGCAPAAARRRAAAAALRLAPARERLHARERPRAGGGSHATAPPAARPAGGERGRRTPRARRRSPPRRSGAG